MGVRKEASQHESDGRARQKAQNDISQPDMPFGAGPDGTPRISHLLFPRHTTPRPREVTLYPLGCILGGSSSLFS